MDMERHLAIPDKFRQTALSFPDQVDKALALVENVNGAKSLLDQSDLLSRLAHRTKADLEIVNAIQYGRLAIVAKVANLSPPDTTRPKYLDKGHPAVTTGCPDSEIPARTLSTYRKVQKHLDKRDEYRDYCGLEQEITINGFVRFVTGKGDAHVSANTGIPEWYTPAEYIEAARKTLGTIDLDPASSKTAQKTVKAKRYFTVDDDGLSQEWKGNVWLNPPYTADLVDKFVKKLCEHVIAGNNAILLVNNATETKWFQQAGTITTAICFPAGRLKFLDEQGNPGAPLQGQAVLYFGKDMERFIGNFGGFGVCFRR